MLSCSIWRRFTQVCSCGRSRSLLFCSNEADWEHHWKGGRDGSVVRMVLIWSGAAIRRRDEWLALAFFKADLLPSLHQAVHLSIVTQVSLSYRHFLDTFTASKALSADKGGIFKYLTLTSWWHFNEISMYNGASLQHLFSSNFECFDSVHHYRWPFHCRHQIRNACHWQWQHSLLRSWIARCFSLKTAALERFSRQQQTRPAARSSNRSAALTWRLKKMSQRRAFRPPLPRHVRPRATWML